MKKFISAVLATFLTVTSFSAVSIASANDAEPEPATLSAEFVSQITENGSKLPNTYAKIKKGENINLGYFGGSVTNGWAPANPPYNTSAPTQGGNCWRGRSQVWLNDTYGTPNNLTIMETNGNRLDEDGNPKKYHAGLGGTGIDLNLYRANNGLGLSTDDPVDLLFIEFSINDSYEGNTYEKSAYYMESTLRMIREKSPTTDIVVMITTDHTKLTQLGNSKLHEQGQAHVDVAEYYGIPWFWFGDYMYEFLISENEKLGNGRVLPSSGSALWQTYMADGCHPSVQGYQKYFEFLRDNFLKPNLDNENGTFSTTVVNYTVPEIPYNQTQAFLDGNKEYHANSGSVYYNEELRRDATDVAPANIRNFGKAGYGYNPGNNGIITATSTNPGMAFSVKVKAKSAGMFYTGHPDKGMIQYRVDGGEWKYHNMYKSSTNQNEYFMFFEKLEEKEHTVDVILRKTMNGSAMYFRGIFLDGDSTGFGAEILEGAPNNTPLNDLVQTPIVLTPELLNTRISGGGYTNNGSSFEVYHHGVTDTDVLRYTPNPASSDTVASDCYNSTFTSVSLPTYKYAVIKYYYELEPGTTESNAEGNRPFINFLQLVDNKACGIASADKLILGGVKANNAIIDLTAITARTGHKGNLKQMHFRPYGENVKGSNLVATELMNVDSISFYAEYPFSDEYDIEVAVNGGAGTNVNLDGKRILPSAHKYATVKYNAEEDATITLEFNGLYDLAAKNYNKTFTASKAVKAGEGEVIIPLTEIAESGQTYYYGNVKTNADKNVTFDSITFSVNYPNPDAEFEVVFDANGGEGEVPAPVKGKIGHVANLPTCTLTNGQKLFLGWAKTPDSMDVVSEVIVPVDGMTLYAVYADAATLIYDANGGTGTCPSSVKVLIGRETTLVSADLSKPNSVFVGWGTTPDATTTVDKITMDDDGVTLYAVYRQLDTVYVAADGKLTYNGKEYDATYTSLANAYSALGTKGGHIIFEGVFSGTIGVSGAPIYILEGADDTAGLTFAANTDFKCNMTLKNMAFLKSGGDPYFNLNGKKVILDEGFGFYNYDANSANFRGTETGLKAWFNAGQVIVNDVLASAYFVGGRYGGETKGNTYIEINDGASVEKVVAGSFNFGNNAATYNHNGNATVVVNGGKFSTKAVNVDFNSTFKTNISGAASVIFNNGMYSGFTVDPKFKYVINSSRGGKVSLAAEGSSNYAPTFLIKAENPLSSILIDGEEVEAVNGEYLFMPKSAGTFTVSYVASPVVYVNTKADANGKITVDGKEYPASATLTAALNNLDSAGGKIYFDGDVSLFDIATASTGGYTSLEVIGVGDSSVMVFDKSGQPSAFGCDITIRNCHFRNDVPGNYPYLRATHVVTIGSPDDTVEMTFTKKNNSGTYDASSFEAIVTATGGKFVVNKGIFAKLGHDFSGINRAATVQVEINGGTVYAGALRPFFGNYNGAASTTSGHYAATINGGSINGTAFDLTLNSNISGNTVFVFNNGMMTKQAYTFKGVDYLVNAPEGIKVEIQSVGTSTTAPTFKLTPAEGIEKVFVNKAEVAANGGVYTYTPTAEGTFVVEADLVLPTATFVKGEGETGDAPASVTGNVGAEIAIPECTLAKEGKRLAGWATTAGKVNPEFTTTFTMTAGGITLYPVWRDADTIYVSNTGSLKYNGVEYTADYTDLIAAQTARAALGGTFVFKGAFDIYKVCDQTYGKAPYVTFAGIGDESILYAKAASAVNAKPFTAIVRFNNVRIVKCYNDAGKITDLYFNGNNKAIYFENGTTFHLETEAGTLKFGESSAELKTYEPLMLILNSGKAASQMHMGGYVNQTTSGNKYLEIGGTATPASAIQLGGLAFGAKTFTHNGNITVVINGGNLAASHSVNVDRTSSITTTVNGAVSAILNNGVADKSAFTFDAKVEYVIKSAEGGTVSLKTEGSETTAPTFGITTDKRNNILIDGEVVSENGSYDFTPSDKGTFTITYEKRPVNATVEFTANLVSGAGSAIVDTETGFDSTAYITFDGESTTALNDIEGGASKSFTLSEGEHSFKITKNGYISYEGTVTVDADGNVSGLREIDLIAGDIKASYSATEGDGKIDIEDFIRVLRGFNNLGDENLLLRQIVDINGDGSVNVTDLAAIKLNYGKTAASYAEND